ncbi:hypothetical protein ACQPYE_26290 [Actinosynnema sp. CA-299493]
MGDAYFPTAHIHVLAVPFPVISLTLSQRLMNDHSGVQKQITFSRHAEEFQVAAEGMRRQSGLSLDEPPGIVDVVRALHEYAKNRHDGGHPPAVHEVEQSILVAAVCAEEELVDEGIAVAASLVEVWPSARLPLDWVSGRAWLDGISDRARQVDELARVVDQQVDYHKLGNIPNLI